MNNEETKNCYNCGCTTHVNEGVQWGRYFYCDSCFKDLKCCIDGYHSPSVSLSMKKSSSDLEDEKLHIGIELEVTKDARGYLSRSNHIDALFFIRKNYKKLGLNIESDSSIGDGFEIITQPMTYKYIKENENKFKDILTYLSENGYYSHDKGKCGLHIHVSKSALGDTDEEIQQTIEKIMLFVETYRPKVETFSRRKHQQYSCYNAYTVPYHKERCVDNFQDEYYKSGKLLYEINKNDLIGHSSVVNTDTSTGITIEFRMFRGTLRYETFMATIEFINNLVHVCKENMVSKISWNKVVTYGGDFIKDYVDSLNIIDDGLYLRDYTKQLEDIISKKNITRKEVLNNYKKHLSDIETSMKDLLNAPIDFSSNVREIRGILDFRQKIFQKLSNILIEDVSTNDNASLYRKLSDMNRDYSEQCKTNLKALQNTLEGHIYFTLSNDMRDIVKNTIKVLKTMIQERTTSEEC